MKSKVRYLALFCLFSVIDSFEWFCMESLHNNIQLMLVFLKGPFLVLHFSNYVKMDVSFLEEKPSFKMLVLSFSSKLDWGFQIVYIARTSVASLHLFYKYYFGRCSSELAQLVLFPYSCRMSPRYCDRFYNFSVIVPRFCKDVYVNSFFACTAMLWDSVFVECFPLTYCLNSSKSRVNRHLLSLSVNSMRHSGCSGLDGVNSN